LQAYADVVGVKTEDCNLFFDTAVIEPIDGPYVVIQAARTNWVGRNWHVSKFDEIARRLMDRGIKVVCAGTEGEHKVPCDIDCRGQYNIHQFGSLLRNALFFVGIDSMPLHIAQAVGTKMVCFFGSIKPETRICTNHIFPITANDLPCLGCHHRKFAPAVCTDVCELGTLDCESLVTSDDAWKIISNWIG
jgi:ADP-heptose:LPS heptosyltransferase